MNTAIELAQPLQNPELQGRLLYKRGLALYEARRFPEALADLEKANQLVPQLTSPLAGSILLELGLVRSYLAQPGSLTDASVALQSFDRAEKYTRLAQTDGGMGIRYDSGRYLTARGEGLLALGRYQDAEEMFDLATVNTSPDLTRRHLFIDLQTIKFYIAEKEYVPATALAQDVVGKARAVGSLYSLKNLEEMAAPLFASNYGKSDDAQELLALINKTKKKLL